MLFKLLWNVLGCFLLSVTFVFVIYTLIYIPMCAILLCRVTIAILDQIN